MADVGAERVLTAEYLLLGKIRRALFLSRARATVANAAFSHTKNNYVLRLGMLNIWVNVMFFRADAPVFFPTECIKPISSQVAQPPDFNAGLSKS